MKKAIAFVVALTVSIGAFAQVASQPEEENVLFKHVSVGVGIDLTNGVQIQAATTLLPNLQARIKYTTMSPYLAIANGVTKNLVGFSVQPLYIEKTDINYHKNGWNIDEIQFSGSARQRSLSILADFFPFKKSSFRVSGGLMFGLQKSIVSGTGKLVSKDGQPSLPPSDRGKKKLMGLTTDLDGNVNIRSAYGLQTLQPYLGIGFGRPVDTKRRVNVNFDLGVAYVGGVHVYGQNYMDDYPNCREVELNSAWIKDPANQIDGKTIEQHLGEDAQKVIKYVDMANSFPVLPYLNITLNVRLF